MVAIFVGELVIFLLVSFVFARRNDGTSVVISDIHEDFSGIISLVPKNAHTLFDDVPQQRNGLGGVMCSSGSNNEPHGFAATVNHRVYLRGQAAPASGDFPIGFYPCCIILPLDFEFFLYPHYVGVRGYMFRLFVFQMFPHGSA